MQGCREKNPSQYTGNEKIKRLLPITIHFRSVDIVTVPDEEEIIATMEEIRNNPTKVAKNKGKRCNPNGLHRILHRTFL